MVNFNENGNASRFGKSQNSEGRPSFNRGSRSQFNRGNRQNYNRNNNRGNNTPYYRGNSSFDKRDNNTSNWQDNYERRQNFSGPRNFGRRNNDKPWPNRSTNQYKKFHDTEVEVNDTGSSGENQQISFEGGAVEPDLATANNQSESSSTEEEIVIQSNKMASDSETSESEDEDELTHNDEIREVESSESEDEDKPVSNNKTEEIETSESEEIELNVDNKGMETSSSEDDSQTEDNAKEIKELEILNNENEVSAELSDQQYNGISNKVDKTNLSGTVKDFIATSKSNCTVRVMNIPLIINERHLVEFFGKFGKINMLRRCNAPQAFKKSHACDIIFENRTDALKALEVNGMEFEGKYFRVKLDLLDEPDKQISVVNLHEGITNDDVWRAFETCGIIKEVYQVRNYALVSFESADHVELALATKICIDGQQVEVERRNRKKTQKSLTVQAQSSPNIQIHENKDNSITITLRDSSFTGLNVGRKTRKHQVKSGFVGKKW